MILFDRSRRLVAEGLGTALLVATVVGSGIMADRLSNDTAVSLLGNTLPTGAMLVVLITPRKPSTMIAGIVSRTRLKTGTPSITAPSNMKTRSTDSASASSS